MSIIEFDQRVSWYDLSSDQVRHIAILEDDARARAKNLAHGVTGLGLVALERVNLAEQILEEYNTYASQYLGQLAAEMGLLAETSSEPLILSAEEELRAKLPKLFSPEYEGINRLKVVRFASGHKGENGKQLRLREVAEATKYSTSYIWRLENDERPLNRGPIDSMLAYYSGLHDLEGSTKVAFYHLFAEDLGDLALPTE